MVARTVTAALAGVAGAGAPRFRFRGGGDADENASEETGDRDDSSCSTSEVAVASELLLCSPRLLTEIAASEERVRPFLLGERRLAI